MALFETLLADAGVKCAERAFEIVSRNLRQTDFLCYDPSYLIDCYRDEDNRIGTNLPYVELASFLGNSWDGFLATIANLRVTKNSEPFELMKAPPPELTDLQSHALAQFREEGRLDRDDVVLRLEAYDPRRKTLFVQRCSYSDGLRSNYAMDLRGHLKLGNSDISLRAVFQGQYGKKLPPLSDKRLSNAVGIAVVIFYKTEKGEILPYLPLRTKPGIFSETFGTTKKQAVFHGGYHCTASGETIWMNNRSSFKDIFTQDICRELDEEVGIKQEDLRWIYPVSLCRELLRGGKPQLFFVGYTKLTPREINLRRGIAIRRQIAQGRQEIEDEALVIESPEQLYAALWSRGTLESVANMALAQDCAILANQAKQFL